MVDLVENPAEAKLQISKKYKLDAPSACKLAEALGVNPAQRYCSIFVEGNVSNHLEQASIFFGGDMVVFRGRGGVT